MEFRRIPFQFSTTDPLKRQEELQRRFGLPANKDNMYVDFANNPGVMGTRSETSSSNSPRLQHRVPIFVEGQSEPTKPSVDAQNVDSGRKPHVRVIPIELDGEDNKRRRWFSDSSEPFKERFDGVTIPVKTEKHFFQDVPLQSPKAPRVCNIPIKIEGSNHVIKPKLPVKTREARSPINTEVKLNDCNASKVVKVNEKKEHPKGNEKRESPDQVTLKKIVNIEEKLQVFHADVEKFSGTNKEKQYRYLDEMLTRCMLELDEIDTIGLDTIRLARKAAIKKVQASIDLLESKIIKENYEDDQVLKELIEVDKTLENANDAFLKLDGTETKSEETVPIKTHIDSQIHAEGEKIENISIMEIEEGMLKPHDKEPISNNDDSTKDLIVTDKMNCELKEPVEITEVEARVDTNVYESEPVVEEPLSDSKDENVDVDQDGCNYDCGLKLHETSSVQICELEGGSALNLNNREQSNFKMEVAETSDVPVLSGNLSTQDADCVDSNNDSISKCIPNIPVNL